MKTVFVLVLLTFSILSLSSILFTTPEVFGNREYMNMTISTDKEAYYNYETVKVTGHLNLDEGIDIVGSKFKFEKIEIILSPNYGGLIKPITIDVDENGNFSHEVNLKSLDDRLSASFKELNDGSHRFFIKWFTTYQDRDNPISTRFYIGDVAEHDRLKNWIDREPSIMFDSNKIYGIDDMLTLTGNTAKYGRVVNISISNPDNSVVVMTGFVSDSDGNFSYDIDLSTLGTFANQKYTENLINGTYKIIIDSLGEKHSKERIHTFEFLHMVKSHHDDITLSFEKELYGKNDLIVLTGTVPKEYLENTIKISVRDPYGEPVNSFKRSADEDGNFEVRFFSKGDFKSNGEYKMIVDVDSPFTNKIIEQTFQYHNPNLVDIKKLDSQVQQIDEDVTDLRTDVNVIRTDLDNLTEFVVNQFEDMWNMLLGTNSTVPP